MEMLAVVIEDRPEAEGAIFKESYSCAATLEHNWRKDIPGSAFSDLLEGPQDVAAHHSQSGHAPRVQSRSGNVFYGVGLEAAPLFSSTYN